LFAAYISAVCIESHATVLPLPPEGDDLIGDIRIVYSRHEDTLLDIARKHSLGYNEITAANPGVDPWLPGEGTRIVLPLQFVLPPGPRTGIVLNLAQMRLFYFLPKQSGKSAEVMTLPVGIGTDYARTPLGVTRVVRKAADPVWRPPIDVREEHAAEGDWLPAEVKPGPDNPLGKYGLYLALPGAYLIHGTNKPWGIGMRVSHGCIRLYPEGIEALYPLVPVGTPVRIIDEPYVIGWSKGIGYLQAFAQPDTRANEQNNLTPFVQDLLKRFGNKGAPDWHRALTIATEKRGIALPILPGSPTLETLLQAAEAQSLPVQ
jgi:L,D-transpeptidase ErfK/SrfK